MQYAPSYFQDIYEWTGKPRVINIEKAEIVLGEISIEYSDCFDIAKDAKYVLSEMNAFDWQTASFENVARTFSNYMAKLWKVHPYREGNTRTIVTFVVCSLRHREFILRVICLRIMPLICARPW